MKTQLTSIPRFFRPPVLLIALIFLIACGTLEAGLERNPTPDPAVATLAALATENAHLATQMATLQALADAAVSLTPTPTYSPTWTPTPAPTSTPTARPTNSTRTPKPIAMAEPPPAQEAVVEAVAVGSVTRSWETLWMLAAMIAKMGDVAMAAHQIALQVIHFSFLPAVSAADAASVLIGQAVGAGRNDLVRPLARLGFKVAAAYTGLCALVFALGGGWLADGFTDDPALITVTTRLLLVAAVFQVFDGGYMVARAALRGTGDVRFPAVVCVVVSWVCTPPLAWLLFRLLVVMVSTLPLLKMPPPLVLKPWPSINRRSCMATS